MAVQIDSPRRPINVVLRSFARQAVQQLEQNFRTQHVWPTEIYPGFAKVNEIRKQRALAGHKQWYSTGEGAKSFTFEVMSASQGNETIRIEFNHYLRFVDMGVGQGRPFEAVDTARKARFRKRYITIWSSRDADTHRPAIMMEMRHLEARMQNYIEDYYGREVSVQLYRTFSGLKAIDLNV